MKEIAEACSRFMRCCVNNCPLDTGYPGLSTSSLDTQIKCRLGKVARLKITAKYPEMAARLKFGGLTPREFSAKQRNESLSEEQKAVLIERAKKARQVRTCGVKVK